MKEFRLSRRDFFVVSVLIIAGLIGIDVTACSIFNPSLDLLPPESELTNGRRYSWEGSSSMRIYAQLLGSIPNVDSVYMPANIEKNESAEAVAQYNNVFDVYGKDGKKIDYFAQRIINANQYANLDKTKKTYREQNEGITDKFYYVFSNSVNDTAIEMNELVNQAVDFTELSTNNLSEKTINHIILPFATVAYVMNENRRRTFIRLYKLELQRRAGNSDVFNSLMKRIDIIDVNDQLFDNKPPNPDQFVSPQDQQHLNDLMMRRFISLIYKRIK
jgi:hypothetical protein